MKDFVKLTKETWRFYLTALGVILLPVISNNMYVLKEMRLEHKSAQSLYLMADIFINKADGYDLINFWVAITGIAVVLFLRHFSFMDNRTMEFQAFLPVKKSLVVLHDYLCNIGIIIIAWLVTICTFAMAQGLHKNKVVSMSEDLRIEAANAAENLWETGLCYLLYLIGAVSLLYLGSVICKNVIVGMLVMAVAWGMFLFIGNSCLFDLSILDNWLYPDNFLRFIYNIPDKKSIFVILIGGILVLIFLIGLAAKTRELSKGKWFYFRLLDNLAPVVCGAFAAFIFCDIFGASVEGISIALVAGIVVCGILFLLLKRDKLEKEENWEVK